MEPFIGSWELESSNNFDEIMKAVGMNLIRRTVASKTKSVNIFEDLGNGKYRFKSESTFAKTSCDFKLGEEFDEETADGRAVKSIITIDEGVMKHIQEDNNDITTYIDRVVEGDTLKTVSYSLLFIDFLIIFGRFNEYFFSL